MRTLQWIKKLGGHAVELYVTAGLSKLGIPNSLLPENILDDDIQIGGKAGKHLDDIQVKACHPDRSKSFILRENYESWAGFVKNQYVIFVWLGSPSKIQSLQYWIASKKDGGKAYIKHHAQDTSNWERRFGLNILNPEWENNWELFKKFIPVLIK
jgi:hypothetical protein